MSGQFTALWVDMATAPAAGLLGWFGREIWRAITSRAAREAELQLKGWDMYRRQGVELVLLRKVIDRGLRRENAYATGCELLLIAMPQELDPERLQIIRRARELFETALLHADAEGSSGA
jgi:hypothetical protein